MAESNMETIRHQKARIEELEAIVRAVEWWGGVLGVFESLEAACPWCLNEEKYGHTPKCRLAAALERMGRDEQ